MQEENKQKKWEDLSDQSQAVPNLPFEDDQNYQDKISQESNIQIQDIIEDDKVIDNTPHIDLPDNTTITYSGGVPVIHSLQDRENSHYADYNGSADIDNIEATLEKEKRTKIYITVVVIVVFLFISIIFAYIYYKNKADNALASNPVTVNNNTQVLNQIDNPANDLQSLELENKDDLSKNMNINPNLEYLMSFGISEDTLSSIDNVYKSDDKYFILTFKNNNQINLDQIAVDEVYKDFILDFFKLQSIDKFKDVQNNLVNFRYYNTNNSPILVSIFGDHNLIIARDMRSYLEAVEYLQKK